MVEVARCLCDQRDDDIQRVAVGAGGASVKLAQSRLSTLLIVQGFVTLSDYPRELAESCRCPPVLRRPTQLSGLAFHPLHQHGAQLKRVSLDATEASGGMVKRPRQCFINENIFTCCDETD
jgi:hypothetical protein